MHILAVMSTLYPDLVGQCHSCVRKEQYHLQEQDTVESERETCGDSQSGLPHVVLLLELAITVPVTSVHCEQVFSHMKRVALTTRSRMVQSRKNHLVLLQAEHSLLRYLASKPAFHNKVLMRFKIKYRFVLKVFLRKKICNLQIIQIAV